MYAIQYSTKSNIIPLQVPAEPRPGEHITYTRDGRILSGVCWGTITTEVKRFKIDGKHPVVVEYIVEVDAGLSNLRFVTVGENEVMWTKQVKAVCPRCQGARIIGVRNGCDDIPCPDCGFIDEWKVF